MTTETNTQDTAAPAPQTPAHQTSTSTATEGQSQGAKTFTQEEVNALTGDTRKKARETGKQEILKLLGLSSEAELESLKATIEETRKRKEADMSESEKARAELERERKAKSDLEQQLNAERVQYRTALIANAFTAAASKMKAQDTDDVLRYARDKHGEALTALMNESGAIDDKAVAALLEKIKTEKAHYFTATVGGVGIPSNQGQRAQPGTKDMEKAAQQLRRQLKSF